MAKIEAEQTQTEAAQASQIVQDENDKKEAEEAKNIDADWENIEAERLTQVEHLLPPTEIQIFFEKRLVTYRRVD